MMNSGFATYIMSALYDYAKQYDDEHTSHVTEQWCHAQYAVLSSRNSEAPLRIEAHIEDASQDGHHYIIPCIE